MDAVTTHGLTKFYGRSPALRDLDLRVPSGCLFGFLGPNGAGKTTTIRILLGLLRATGGDAKVLGHDCWRDGRRLRGEVAYLPGDVRFHDWLTGRRMLEFIDAARGGGGATEMRRLTERFDLDLDRRIRDYSRGMKQKLGLIAALMHGTRLLILDEPTTSLDPLVRQALYAELRTVVAEGRTVLFSSHTLVEVEALCDEVAILRSGRLVEQERIDVLRERAGRRVEVRFRNADSRPTPPDGLTISEQSGQRLIGHWTGPADRLLEWLARCPVEDATLTPLDLEDLFLGYYADSTDGGGA